MKKKRHNKTEELKKGRKEERNQSNEKPTEKEAFTLFIFFFLENQKKLIFLNLNEIQNSVKQSQMFFFDSQNHKTPFFHKKNFNY